MGGGSLKKEEAGKTRVRVIWASGEGEAFVRRITWDGE